MWTYLDRSRAKLLWSAGCVFAGLTLIFSRTVVTCVQSAAVDAANSTASPSTLQIGLIAGCAATAAVVVCVLLHSIATYPARERSGMRHFHAFGEFCWALVPVVILFGMAAPAVSGMLAGDTAIAQQAAANTGYRCAIVHESS